MTDVGSNREVQGPENKLEKEEVKPLSAQNGQQAASPHQAQGVVNVAPGEGAPKQHTYDELTNQVVKLMDQIKTAADADIGELSKRVAEVEAEVAKRATKVGLQRKLSELSKKLSESAAADAADAAEAEKAKKGNGDAENLPGPPGPKGPKGPDQAETAESAGKPKGKGIISTEEMDNEANGPSAPWFKDLLKANAIMKKSGSTVLIG